MAETDINQRRLFRKTPYWETPQGKQTPQNWGVNPAQTGNNPNVSANAMRDINQDYSPNVGMKPNSLPPLTTGQDSQGNPVLPDEGDAQVSYGDNDIVNQGVGSLIDGVMDNVRIETPSGETYGNFKGVNYEGDYDAGEYDSNYKITKSKESDYVPPTSDALDAANDAAAGGIAEIIGQADEQPLNASEVAGAETEEEGERLKRVLNENKPEGESLEAFAKRIGVKLSDEPYDKWDYIRNMSAGLLASKDTSFLGALGDASLLNNAARSKAMDRDDTKRTSLAVAKWESENREKALDKKLNADIISEGLKAKAKADLAGNPLKLASQPSKTETVNGVTTKFFQVNSGPVDPENAWISPNGTPYFIQTTNDADAHEKKYWDRASTYIDKVVDITDSEKMDRMIKYGGENKSYQGAMLSRGIKSGNGDFDTIFDEMSEARLEGYEHLNTLLKDLDNFDSAAAAAQATSSLEGAGRIQYRLRQEYADGLMAQLSAGEFEEMKYHIGKKATEFAQESYGKNPNGIHRAVDPAREAMNWVMDHMKWDREGSDMFSFESTPAQLDEMIRVMSESTGIDIGDNYFNWGIEGSELSPYDARGDDTAWSTQHNLPGENSLWNLKQFELAKPEHQKLFVSDSAGLLNKMEQQYPQISRGELGQDISDAMMDANILGGGEDLWFTVNRDAEYRKPKSWTMEPELVDGQGNVWDRQKLRDAKIQWQGFRDADGNPGGGHWYGYDKRGGEWRRVQLNSQFENEGFKFNEPRTVKY